MHGRRYPEFSALDKNLVPGSYGRLRRQSQFGLPILSQWSIFRRQIAASKSIQALKIFTLKRLRPTGAELSLTRGSLESSYYTRSTHVSSLHSNGSKLSCPGRRNKEYSPMRALS